ncbi:maestro heat-like repeat-containing protein family member 2A [Alligator mississippiensis]|uniref:Maestro heat-like repeat-containing protein family member 2A n=1 Tax=Alligator mississippiensis TaxID=8496 RepID=A0A151NSX3_ALLMI|nr:maestro heat-like repeat-containing protein family member 2A [Alligator mississippiensis]
MEVIDLKLPSGGFSTSDASAGRCLVDQAQGNLGPGFGQADMDLDITMSLLLERLQQEEETRVTIYSSLQEVLQGDIKSLDRNLVRRIIHLASKDMRETQQENDELQLTAGKTLVALAGTFYNWVMYELQCHMGIMELPPIFFLITLGDMVSAYALRSEPFLVLTLSKLRFVLRLVETDQMKRALCGGECQPLLQVPPLGTQSLTQSPALLECPTLVSGASTALPGPDPTTSGEPSLPGLAGGSEQ